MNLQKLKRFLSQAYVLLGQFLLLKKDEILFQEWLKITFKATAKQAKDCFECLRDWCDVFL